VIVTDELHARRVRLSWKKLSTRPLYLCTFKGLWESRHPVVFGRNWKWWPIANVVAYIVLYVFGLGGMRILRHPKT